MGRILRFRRRARWHKAEQFAPQLRGRLRFGDSPPRGRLRGLSALRPFILGAILVSIWPASDPALIGPPPLLSTGEEVVRETFVPCGGGRAFACVVDGDTFRLGKRRIRIIGIDTPEMDGRCEAERKLARAAAGRLLERLNAGPFTMRGWAHNRRDQYGRELMALTRIGPPRASIADEMRQAGVARRYAGGLRGGWC